MSEINDGFVDSDEPTLDADALAAAIAPVETQDDVTEAPTEGTVRVATRRGYKFILPNGRAEGEDLVVGTVPVTVPEPLVETLIKLSNGRLYVVPETKED